MPLEYATILDAYGREVPVRPLSDADRFYLAVDAHIHAVNRESWHENLMELAGLVGAVRHHRPWSAVEHGVTVTGRELRPADKKGRERVWVLKEHRHEQ